MNKIKTYSCLFFFFCISTIYAHEKTIIKDTLNHIDSVKNILLHEVKVIARENRSATTSSVIGLEAIQHVQPFSITDLMQLLPGGTTPNVSFKEPTYFTIRHIGNNLNTNALGTGISIDGVRISSNADLQQLPEQNGSTNFSTANSQKGIDTREISTDNIESVEVIRGIPSVRYGDITSGMVIVHTRKNISPLTANIRFTPQIKSFNTGKGWQIKPNETFHLSTGYTRANSDINTTENIYHRISIQTAYSRHFNRNNRPLYIEAGAAGDITINKNPQNTLLQPGEYIKAARQSFRFNFSGKWESAYKLLTDINWKISTAYAHSISEYNRYFTTGYTISSDATVNKEQEGFFIPPQHWKNNGIESCPIEITTELNFHLRKSANNWKSLITIGIEWNSEGNNGHGKTYKTHTPTLPSQPSYNFRHLPFMHHYAGYIEEKLQKGNLTLEAGIRISGISVRGKTFHPVAEPRLNLNYLLLQHPYQNGLRLLRIRGGIGLLRKMPTFSYLFGEDQYNHITNYRYLDDAANRSLVIVTTAVSSLGGTESLKLPQNFKTEIGFSGIIGDFSFDVTGFYEQLSRGFKLNSSITPIALRNYNSDTKPGLQPEYLNGEVCINGKPVGYTNDTTFNHSERVGNHLYQHKGGIEFTLRSNYISPLASTFILDGAWIIQHTTDKSLSPIYKAETNNERSYPMCGIYDNAAKINTYQQFTTTLRAVTEIPVIRLTTTIALQSVWIDRSQRRPATNALTAYYMKDDLGNRITHNLTKEDKNIKYIDPAYYMDTHGAIHRFTPELADNPTFSKMVDQIPSRFFIKDSYSPYFMLNLRVSKNIGDHFCVSFFANNLAQMNPKRYLASNGQYRQMNPPAFFGAELQIKL
ncbi:MAG: TonB-dependent receptor [Odoribacter sp.]